MTHNINKPTVQFLRIIFTFLIVLVEENRLGAGEIPSVMALSQNYPNPFNPSTTIRFGLPEAADVTLEVYNLLGQRVAMLVDGERTAGYHVVTFDAGHLSSGVYLYRLRSNGLSVTRSLNLLK